MLNVKSTLAMTICVAVLGGCATAETYKNTPTAKLCVDYISLPSINLNHSARAEELARRGEDCNQYIGAAKARIDANAAFDNALKNMQKSNPPPQIPMPTRTTCQKNGQYLNCTTY